MPDYDRSADAEVLRRFLMWLSKQERSPYGQMSYWIDLYLRGEDASGKKEQT